MDFRHNQRVNPRRLFSFTAAQASLNAPFLSSRFDYLATQTGAIIVPSSAVDSIPADAGVYLASQTLGHAPLGASTTASRMGGAAPPGTIATFIATAEDVPRPLLARSARDWALSPVPGARSPPLRFVYRLGSRRGAVAPFGAINRALVQRTAGLLELARLERSYAHAYTEEPPPGYGPAFTYTEFMQTGGAVSAFFASLAIATVFVGLTFVTPVRLCPLRLPRSLPPCVLTLPLAAFVLHSSGGWSSVSRLSPDRGPQISKYLALCPLFSLGPGLEELMIFAVRLSVAG